MLTLKSAVCADFLWCRGVSIHLHVSMQQECDQILLCMQPPASNSRSHLSTSLKSDNPTGAAE
jgi:hypothetical protein